MADSRALNVEPRRLLVTGVPGWLSEAFLGSLASSPLPGLEAVRCLVKGQGEPTALRSYEGKGLEIVRGNLRDPESLRRAVDGVDAVVHCAGIIHVDHTEDYYAVNTQGTRSLAVAAARAGVRRFVYVSTNAAAGRSEAADELMLESSAEKPLSHYGRSKLLGERWLFESSGRMESVVLRPCMFYGPPVPDRHVEIYKRIIGGFMPLVGGGGYARSLTHIDNLVQAIRLALTVSGIAGRVYYIADRQPYTTRRVVEAMASALGVRPRFLPLPAFVARASYFVDSLLAMQGIYQQTLHLVGEADWNVGVSIERARADLGYEPSVGLEDGMRAAVTWCRDRGLLS
jgi:nucleoside-diphosphate-sugar epimerase